MGTAAGRPEEAVPWGGDVRVPGVGEAMHVTYTTPAPKVVTQSARRVARRAEPSSNRVVTCRYTARQGGRAGPIE